MSYSHVERANVLAEALPYIQKYNGKTVAVKYAGNAMISEELRRAVISDIILLHLVGLRVVVVHGGGPEITEMLGRIGKESRFVDGLRYTDGETMDIVQQILCGKVNKNLVATLNRMGGKAIGLCGMDAGLFQAKELDPKYGLVGEITGVDPALVVGVRRSQFSCEALVNDRRAVRRRYPELTVDPVTLEEIMVFTVKGERL